MLGQTGELADDADGNRYLTLGTDLDLVDVAKPLLTTSALMLTAGLLACVEPARRALRIHPTDALKEA